MNNRSVGIDRLARARMIREREDLEKGLGQMIGDQYAKFKAGRQYGKLDPTEQGQVDAQVQQMSPGAAAGKQGYQNAVMAQRRGLRSQNQANQMVGGLIQGQQQSQQAAGQQGGGNNAYAQQHAQLLAQQAQGQPKAQGGMGYNPMAVLATGGLSALAQAGKNYFKNRQNQQKQQQAMGQLAQMGQQGGGQQPQAPAPEAPAPAGAPPAPPAPPVENPSVPLPGQAPNPSVPLPAPGEAANEKPPVPQNPDPDSTIVTASRPFWNIGMLDSADRIYKGMDYLRYRK